MREYHNDMPARIDYDRHALRNFCDRWGVTELAFFGSVLRDDFRPDSDVDVLFRYDREKCRITLFDMCHMQDELETIFGRRVDLISRGGIEASRNFYLKRGVLGTAEVIDA